MCQRSIFFFKVKFDQHFVQRATCMVMIDFTLADIKLESSDTYLLKTRKNLSQDFKDISIYHKHVVLKIRRYLKGFYTYKKINKSFHAYKQVQATLSKILKCLGFQQGRPVCGITITLSLISQFISRSEHQDTGSSSTCYKCRMC